MNTIMGLSSAGITIGWGGVLVVLAIFFCALLWHMYTLRSLRNLRRREGGYGEREGW